jgi:hypothetical protein
MTREIKLLKPRHYLVRVKVKLSLRFNWAPRHVVVLVEWRYSSTHSLISALDGGEWSALRPGRFTPTERVPDTHWIGGWEGPRASMDVVARIKKSQPLSGIECRSSSPQPSRYTNWSAAAPTCFPKITINVILYHLLLRILNAPFLRHLQIKILYALCVLSIPATRPAECTLLDCIIIIIGFTIILIMCL